MKLDKIKFARLVNYLASFQRLEDDQIEKIDDLIDIDVEPVSIPLNLSAVDGLMARMAAGTQKIEAIKYYRSLTGASLIDAKNTVEKYWMARTSED